jgi:enoyl-CoA hydratase
MSYATLLTELNEGIYTITINRPDKLNALNQTVLAELENAIEEIYQNKTIRSVIITGAGAKAFVAGADISEFLGLCNNDGNDLATKGQDIFC